MTTTPCTGAGKKSRPGKRDPVARVRQYLIENRLLTEADEERIDNEVIEAGPGGGGGRGRPQSR